VRPADRYGRAIRAASTTTERLYRAAQEYAAAWKEGAPNVEVYEALECAALRFANARRGVAVMRRRLYGPAGLYRRSP
jgi:hypothetical protein